MSLITKLPTEQDRLANSDFNMTLDEVGQELGVTRERVRQIQNKALEKLRRRCMPQLLIMRDLATDLRRRNHHTSNGVIQ